MSIKDRINETKKNNRMNMLNTNITFWLCGIAVGFSISNLNNIKVKVFLMLLLGIALITFYIKEYKWSNKVMKELEEINKEMELKYGIRNDE